MAEYLIQDTTLEAIGDAIRGVTGKTTVLTPDEGMPAEISELSDTRNDTVTASKMLSGTTAHDSSGQPITGSIASRTSSNVTASGATVTVPAGHYASQVTKSVTTATRADTTISVTADDTNDKLTITASNNQGTGYVTGANKTATKTITLSASGAMVTASDGTNSISKSVATATRANTTISTTANDTSDTLTYTASNNQSTGYVTGANKTATKTVTLTTSGATATMSDGTYSVSKSVTTASRADTTMSVTANDTNDTLTITASNNQGTGYVTGANKTATATVTLTTSGATATMSDGSKSVSKSVTTASRADTTMSTTANDTADTLTITASNNQGTGYVTGANKTASTTVTLTTSGATATMSDGSKSVSKSVTTANRASTTISTTANDTNDTLTFTASNNQATGYVTGSNQTATKTVTLTASGTSVTASDGTYSVSKSISTQSKQVTPTASGTTVKPDSGYGALSQVTINGDSNLIASNIKNGTSIFGVTGNFKGNGIILDPQPAYTYTVSSVSGVTYGFSKNSSGYWQSGNKGIASSYALCRVNFTVNSTCNITFSVINYAENNYDYGIFGYLDTALAKSASADSSSYKSYKSEHSSSAVTLTYNNISAGSHFIDVKFIKDSSQNTGNDTLQFKVHDAPTSTSLSESDLAAIRGADSDLVASNIKSGVEIFGVTGTYAPSVNQATPSISVSSSGLITASATQSAGYVSSGTKSATKQLTTQGTQTITPGTSNKTISSGTYITGTQTISGDSNLVSSNIKSGVSIFGVSGSYSGSSVSLQSNKTVTPTTSSQTVKPDSGYSGLSQVTVNAIPSTYKQIQRKTGTFTTNAYGNATVNCGFSPDIVYIQGVSLTQNGYTVYTSMTVCFAEDTRGNLVTTMYVPSGGYTYMFDIRWTRTTTGFSCYCQSMDFSYNQYAQTNLSIDYVAIKYT